MRNPFGRRNHSQAESLLQDMRVQFKSMDSRFHRLEESLDRLNARQPHVTIENVHIHQPVLEKMEFRLDALDIEQLSGSLNLGNNFGARIAPERKSDQANTQKKNLISEDKHPDTGSSSPGLHRTPSGFRLNNRR